MDVANLPFTMLGIEEHSCVQLQHKIMAAWELSAPVKLEEDILRSRPKADTREHRD
jgi:hypothetical protein